MWKRQDRSAGKFSGSCGLLHSQPRRCHPIIITIGFLSSQYHYTLFRLSTHTNGRDAQRAVYPNRSGRYPDRLWEAMEGQHYWRGILVLMKQRSHLPPLRCKYALICPPEVQVRSHLPPLRCKYALICQRLTPLRCFPRPANEVGSIPLRICPRGHHSSR